MIPEYVNVIHVLCSVATIYFLTHTYPVYHRYWHKLNLTWGFGFNHIFHLPQNCQKKTFIFHILYQSRVYISDTLDSFIFISMSMWHKSLLLTYRVAKTPLILFPKTIIQLCWHRLFQAAVASTRRKLTNIRLFKNNSGFGKQCSHVEK
jgi:hypothetical protein